MTAINSATSAQSKLKSPTQPTNIVPPKLPTGLQKQFEDKVSNTSDKVTAEEVPAPSGKVDPKLTEKLDGKQPGKQPSNVIPLPKVVDDVTPKKTDSPKPTAAQEKKLDEAGAEAVADYKTALAFKTKRADLAEAITGAKATKEEKAAVDKHLQKVAESKDAPKFDVAAVGTAKDIANGNKKLGPEILAKGIDGAYVAGKKTALISEKLITDDGKAKQGLGAAVREETGEWLAASAAKAGLKVGAGDAGNRLALVLAGDKDEAKDDDLNTDLPADKTTVRMGGKTFEAEAKQEARRGIWLTGIDKGWKVTIPSGKTSRVVANDSSSDWHKSADYIGTDIPRGYSGKLKLSKQGGPTVEIRIENYGSKFQKAYSITAGWSLVTINKETFQIVDNNVKNNNRDAFTNAAQNFLNYTSTFATSIQSALPTGVPSAAIMNSFAENLQTMINNYSNPSYGFPVAIQTMSNAMLSYAKLGATQAEMKSALNAAAGSTLQNGNPPFTEVLAGRMKAITDNLNKMTEGFANNVKDQKAWEKAQERKATIQMFIAMASDIIAVGGAGAAVGIILSRSVKSGEFLKSMKSSLPALSAQLSSVASSGIAVGNDVTFWKIAESQKAAVTDSFSKVVQQVNAADRETINKLSESSVGFFDAMKNAVGTAVLMGKPKDKKTDWAEWNQGSRAAAEQRIKEHFENKYGAGNILKITYETGSVEEGSYEVVGKVWLYP